MTEVIRRLGARTRATCTAAAVVAGSFASIAAMAPGVAQAASCTKPVERYYNPERIRTTEHLCASYLSNHGWVVYSAYVVSGGDGTIYSGSWWLKRR